MSADEIDGKSLNLPELEQAGWSWAGSVWKRPRWLKAALAAGQSFSSTLRGLSLLPIHENLPFIGPVKAVENFHDRTFSRSVFSHKSHKLPLRNGQIYIVDFL